MNDMSEVTLENIKKIVSTESPEEISSMIFGLEMEFDPYYKKDIKDKDKIIQYLIDLFIETEYEIIRNAIYFLYFYFDLKDIDPIRDNLNKFEEESLFIALIMLLDTKNEKYSANIEKNKIRLPEDKLEKFNNIQSSRERDTNFWENFEENKKNVVYNYDALKY